MQNLSDELNNQKRKLKPSETRVTTPDGRSYVERKDSSIVPIQCQSLCPGFVVDTKPDLRHSQILNQLFLGSQDVAHDLDILTGNKITHILNVSTGILNLFDGWFVYKTKEALDTPEFPLLEIFDDCCNFIHSNIVLGGRVLVHCNAGVSRSASVVIAYLMKHYSMNYDEAFRFVKKKRSFIRPNEGFVKQLKLYGKTLETS